MKLPENDYQILKLTPVFYEKYLKSFHTEILHKNSRAYNCLLFQTHYDYFIAVPYRSEITHKYAYHFKYSKRSRKHKSGLDYIDYQRGKKLIDEREFQRRYRFSTLKYFHKELGIEKSPT